MPAKRTKNNFEQLKHAPIKRYKQFNKQQKDTCKM